MKPTTGKISAKRYRCKRCGHVKQISTNHYGECYSAGHFNVCPACPPHAKYPEYCGSTTWECLETCPPDMDVPPKWQTVTVEVKRLARK